MCLLVVSPEGSNLDRDLIEAAYLNNSDGFGFFFPDGSELGTVIKILPKNVKDILEIYDKYAKPELAYGMHFRFRTSGNISRHMAHPFLVARQRWHGETWWLAHNGTISDTPEPASMSDTWGFVKYYLRPIVARNPSLLYNNDFISTLEKLLGYGNKLVFMNATTGKFGIVNKSAGKTLEDGAWISNTYSLKRGKGHDYTFGDEPKLPHSHWGEGYYDYWKEPANKPTIIVPGPTLALPKPRITNSAYLQNLTDCKSEADIFKLFQQNPEEMVWTLYDYVNSINVTTPRESQA